MIWGCHHFWKHPYLIWFASEVRGVPTPRPQQLSCWNRGRHCLVRRGPKVGCLKGLHFQSERKLSYLFQFSIVFPFMAENESLSFWLMDDPDLQQHEPMPGTDGWSEGTQGVPTRLSGRSDLELEKHLMSAAWQLSSLWSHFRKSLMKDL